MPKEIISVETIINDVKFCHSKILRGGVNFSILKFNNIFMEDRQSLSFLRGNFS